MTWWKSALYDTCSLITLDKLLLERPTIERHFPRRILALEKSFSADQMRVATVKRMKKKVTIQELPSPTDLATVYSSVSLSVALAEVDKLVCATAIHFGLSVVTGDRRLGRTLRDQGLQVTDMVSILRELAETGKITQKGCVRLLKGLAKRHDLLLGKESPTWEDIESHKFPDR